MLTYFQMTTSGEHAYLLARDESNPIDVRCVETYHGPDAGEQARKAAERLNRGQFRNVKQARAALGSTSRLGLTMGRIR